MLTAIVVYIGVGLLVGAVTYLAKSETSSMAGMLGSGGAGGLIGGVVANLIFSDGIDLDLAGLAGSVILAIVVVLTIRVGDRKRASEVVEAAPPVEPEHDEPPAD